ncbi:YaaC family protein [Bacillus sp. EB106-08-02-XG196]|uniref:YaaC family protein n=1 Tax=Bacillus sp. EB106-08-02-XG196 TaxID=2737049 RepID=UPI0015C4E4E9|nr:YaaC family protein [Bacillus sp. EB106-08-02-XG196]NWQ44663.1 YaaC family protein [Bacillus sp. EB106-08-02-XG196]
MAANFNGWKSYASFFSAEHCQTYLKSNYKKWNIDNPEQKSYENCYAFLYYLEHGQIYYQQAENAPLILKPILLFYGLVHLIKACILTIDPAYPETTSVLAHGVSTRKRKKQNYQFFQDEVKFQKNGLFPFMSEKMFHMKRLEGDKITMEELLELIPELDDLFMKHESKSIFTPIYNLHGQLAVPEKILDQYHMTEERLKEFLTSKSGNQIEFSNEGLLFQFNKSTFTGISPIKFNLENGSFVLPLKKENLFVFPELLVHYLLLYNLSMIARYETEWWSELTKMMPNRDYPFIKTFLEITLHKGPFLIYEYLMS